MSLDIPIRTGQEHAEFSRSPEGEVQDHPAAQRDMAHKAVTLSAYEQTFGFGLNEDEAVAAHLRSEREKNIADAKRAIDAVSAGNIDEAIEIAHEMPGLVVAGVGLRAMELLGSRKMHASPESEEVRFVDDKGNTVNEIIKTDNEGEPSQIKILSLLHTENKPNHQLVEVVAKDGDPTSVDVYVHSHRRGGEIVPVTKPAQVDAIVSRVLNDLAYSLDHVSLSDNAAAIRASRRNAPLV